MGVIAGVPAKLLREIGNATLLGVAVWGKASKSMPASGVRNHAGRSVPGLQKGALRMTLWVRLLRNLGLIGAVLIGLLLGAAVTAIASSTTAAAQQASSIVVEGNRRVEAETIRSYFHLLPGERLDLLKIDRARRRSTPPACFRTFGSRQSGNRLVVVVVENPVLNRVAFEGNKKIKDEQLNAEVQSKSRGTLSRPLVQADVQRPEIYRRNGRFDVQIVPKIIELPNNRVDLVFEINEGARPPSRARLRGQHRLSRLADQGRSQDRTLYQSPGFLPTADIYDPDSIEADRDLFRPYYLKHGYADVRVRLCGVGSMTRRSRDLLVTFTIEEGARYRFGKVEIQSSVPVVDPNTLYGRLRLYSR